MPDGGHFVWETVKHRLSVSPSTTIDGAVVPVAYGERVRSGLCALLQEGEDGYLYGAWVFCHGEINSSGGVSEITINDEDIDDIDWVTSYNVHYGTASQTVDSLLSGKRFGDAGAGAGWAEAFPGWCYIAAKMSFEDIGATGLPGVMNVAAKIKGRKVYDFRVPGNVHDNQNPILHAYDVETDSLVPWKGQGSSIIPTDNWTEWADYCDEVISGDSSARFEFNGDFHTRDARGALKRLLEHCHAWVVPYGGKDYIVGDKLPKAITGTWSSSGTTFTEDSSAGAATTDLEVGDIVVVENQYLEIDTITNDDTFDTTTTPSPAISSKKVRLIRNIHLDINEGDIVSEPRGRDIEELAVPEVVRVHYHNPETKKGDSHDAHDPSAVPGSTATILEAGFEGCTSATQAERHGQLIRRMGLYEKNTWTIHARGPALDLFPGDIFRLTAGDGTDKQPARVLRRVDLDDGTVTLELKEFDFNAYGDDYAAGDTPIHLDPGYAFDPPDAPTAANQYFGEQGDWDSFSIISDPDDITGWTEESGLVSTYDGVQDETELELQQYTTGAKSTYTDITSAIEDYGRLIAHLCVRWENFPATAWYNSSWAYRFRVTVNHDEVDVDITNYDFLVTEEHVPSGFWSHVESDGADVVVTSNDGTTKIDRDLILIDTTNQLLQLRIKTNVYAATDVDLYVYYGNPSASETARDSTVYPTNLEIALPLEEDPGSTTPVDATGNHTPSKSGTWTSGDLVDAGIDKGWDLDSGDSDYFSVPDHVNLDMPDAFTISGFVRIDDVDAAGSQFIVSRYEASGNKRSYWFLWSGTNLRWELYVDGDGVGGNWVYYTFSDSLTDGQWYHFMARYDKAASANNRWKLWIDGEAQTATVQQDVAQTPYPTDIPLHFGADGQGGQYYLDGGLDEMRVYRAGLTDNEITTRIANEDDTTNFYSCGNEETEADTLVRVELQYLSGANHAGATVQKSIIVTPPSAGEEWIRPAMEAAITSDAYHELAIKITNRTPVATYSKASVKRLRVVPWGVQGSTGWNQRSDNAESQALGIYERHTWTEHANADLTVAAYELFRKSGIGAGALVHYDAIGPNHSELHHQIWHGRGGFSTGCEGIGVGGTASMHPGLDMRAVNRLGLAVAFPAPTQGWEGDTAPPVVDWKVRDRQNHFDSASGKEYDLARYYPEDATEIPADLWNDYWFEIQVQHNAGDPYVPLIQHTFSDEVELVTATHPVGEFTIDYVGVLSTDFNDYKVGVRGKYSNRFTEGNGVGGVVITPSSTSVKRHTAWARLDGNEYEEGEGPHAPILGARSDAATQARYAKLYTFPDYDSTSNRRKLFVRIIHGGTKAEDTLIDEFLISNRDEATEAVVLWRRFGEHTGDAGDGIVHLSVRRVTKADEVWLEAHDDYGHAAVQAWLTDYDAWDSTVEPVPSEPTWSTTAPSSGSETFSTDTDTPSLEIDTSVPEIKVGGNVVGKAYMGCKAFAKTNTTLTHNTNVAVAWDDEAWDTDAIHDNVTNNTRLTVPTGEGGRWRCFGQIVIEAAGSSRTQYIVINPRLNGTDIMLGCGPNWSADGSYSTYQAKVQFDFEIELSAGDYIEICVRQINSGSVALDVDGDTTENDAPWVIFQREGDSL